MKTAIKIVIGLVVMLGIALIISSFFAPPPKGTPSDRVRSVFVELHLFMVLNNLDGGAIPTDIGQVYDLALSKESLKSRDPSYLTFKDNLIYDLWGSEIIYSYDADSKTCSFKSFGPNRTDDHGQEDDVVFEQKVGVD